MRHLWLCGGARSKLSKEIGAGCSPGRDNCARNWRVVDNGEFISFNTVSCLLFRYTLWRAASTCSFLSASRSNHKILKLAIRPPGSKSASVLAKGNIFIRGQWQGSNGSSDRNDKSLTWTYCHNHYNGDGNTRPEHLYCTPITAICVAHGEGGR